MYEPATITNVTPLANFHARITFADGTERERDLTPYISGGGVFDPIYNNYEFFEQMTVENDTITWPNGADIDPDALYLGLAPHADEEDWRIAASYAALRADPVASAEFDAEHEQWSTLPDGLEQA